MNELSNGSLVFIKFAIFGSIIFALIGSGVGAAQVYWLEQGDSGKVAIYDQCIEWDDQCVDQCETAARSGYSSGCTSCCTHWGVTVDPLGKRLGEMMEFGAWVGGSFGLVVGLSYAGYRQKSD